VNGQQAFFEAVFDAERLAPPGLTVWNGSDPATRFAVYRNNVMASLIDALADTYPVTQELVGEEFFHAMARLFVLAEPPRSRVLAFYGERFPDFVEHFLPAASVPYLADVARLEMLRVHAYHAADGEFLSGEAIAQILADTDALPDLQVELHPSVGVVRSQYSVVSLWAAHQGITEISSVDPLVPETALVIRQDLNVEVFGLDTGAGAFVAHLLEGESLGRAVEWASHTHRDFDLAGILGLLIQKQAISSMKTSKRV
jgi:hypothetical protein